jgi:hypothetical protein
MKAAAGQQSLCQLEEMLLTASSSCSSDEAFYKLHIDLCLDAMEHNFEPLKNDLLLRAAWGGFFSADCALRN